MVLTNPIGLRRNTIDKYYTKPNIAKHCIQLVKKYIKISKKDLIIEPSAGNGAFIPFIKKLSKHHIFYDLKPDHTEIIKKNYLKLNTDIINVSNKYKKIHVIGNPPFGRKASTALKFIKKSCQYADSISFILPKSFKKDSLKSKTPFNFHLIFQKDLPNNSFTVNGIDHDVHCVFQIWVKKNFNRKKLKKIEPFKYIFVKKTDNPDISVRRVGFKAGFINDNKSIIISKNIETHYFIKIIDNKKIIIKKLKEHTYNDHKDTVGPRSISKQELIRHFNKIIKMA